MKSLVVRTRPSAMASPWVLGSMARQWEDWVDRALGSRNGEYVEARPSLSPRIDFAETDSGYELTADLPGLDEKHVHVSVADHVLTIKGERTSEDDAEARSLHVSERSYGAFRRSMSLPDDVDQAGIEARLRNGVLHIRLPKSKDVAAAAREIKITTK
ncbi:Hsp20/alpha crystallin family protein [Candidatus Foliamicus sp.]